MSNSGEFRRAASTRPSPCSRALRELDRIRQVTLQAGERTIRLVTRRNPLQNRILQALRVDTSSWNKTHIS